MKSKIILLAILIGSIGFYQCGENAHSANSNKGGLSISGNIVGASTMQVYLDKMGLSPTSANLVQAKSETKANGDFSLDLPNKLDAGIYRLRVGAQQVNLILDGSEQSITVNGEIGKLNQFQYDLEGAEGSIAYRDMMQRLAARQAKVEDVVAFTESTPNSLAAAMVALQSLQGNKTYLKIYQNIKSRMAAQFPGSNYLREYEQVLASIQKVQGGKGFQFVEEAQREPAPDINLPSPDGKKYALSDLKGNVVLLDFWASWCRPCRAENPNVVKIYNKYKDKGFTVYSVSLDGVDSRTAARYGGDQVKINQAIDTQKKRWEDAIDKDGLLWDYHVSDLKKWECAPAKLYGVSSIPRTFMIDKEGKIAAMNLRGAEQIEEVLLQLL